MNDVTTEVGAQAGTPDENAATAANVANASAVSSGRPRRVILMALPVVLVVAAVAGAAVHTRNTVDGADRSARTGLWEEPAHKPGKDPAGDVARGRASTGLSKLLLPVPAGYRLGPDNGELGNDGEQSGKKATAVMQQNAHGLAGKERRDYEKRIDRLRIEGIAARTYADDGNTLVISTEIMRMKDKEAVRNLYTFRTGLLEAIDIFRAEPRIEGHTRNARCYVLRKGSGDDIASMNCLAYDGELSIGVTASGSRPFDRAAVAELLKDQLDHIASPGEYV
ncbi:hypothetical protein [Streptomyces sp. NBC_00893]|uniref:hypothetical protein n=1 Tax=Streptomyces sp. NBC_00893 TaxID=2975862 RepID=UPI0022517DE8|nr:hypothetical protein [Streptomyces sp. NBC_00893]MCX4846396.1 hypothetical protein [Streptomyces sp. NBC_00893]